ncbi:MAG: maturase [Planctomycetota bacterium]|nr:maturase [Planctomycetota bacterium]
MAQEHVRNNFPISNSRLKQAPRRSGSLFDRLDQWIRRRLRMCYWKRWRHARTRSRELMRLGVSRRQAIRHGKSRKGYWHMAKTIASGVGLTNAWLQEELL